MASSRKPKVLGDFIRKEEVEQIVRSAVRQTARAAAKQQPVQADTAIDDDRLKRLMKESITETFTDLGFDMSDKAKTQKNVAFMNSLAEFSRASKMKIAMTAIGFGTIAILAMILSALGLPAKVMAIFGLSAGSNLGE